MNIRCEGKKAIVTGAGKGIGRDIAKKLVELGAETYAVSRTQADLDKLKAEVPSINVVQVDLGDWYKSREAISNIGPVDFLVNNAGVSRIEKFTEMSKEDLEVVMNINFNAVFNVSQVVAKGMIERGKGGSIVNLSSCAAQDALLNHANYCPSKAALDSLTKCMALELGEHKIRVNSVNPTIVLTDMGRYAWSDPVKAGPMLSRIPLGRFAEIEDVVNTVMFVLSDFSAMTNGQCIRLDGGFGCH